MRRYRVKDESFTVSQSLQTGGLSADIAWLAGLLDEMGQRMGPVAPIFFVQPASRRPCLGYFGARRSETEPRPYVFWLLEPGDVGRTPSDLVSEMLAHDVAAPASQTPVRERALAVGVDFSTTHLLVSLVGGRLIGAPIAWFPRLRDATPENRRNWRLVADGVGIHWDEIDEDISVDGLLAYPEREGLPPPRPSYGKGANR